MAVELRTGTPDDAERCGEICYRAFEAIAEAHGFPPEFSDTSSAIKVLSRMLASPSFYGIVVESGGRIIGSNFLDERGAIAGLGPVSVDPDAQDTGTGRRLMQHMLDRAIEKRFEGVRLYQSAYHNRSLSLYAKLGFAAREPLSVMAGPPLDVQIPGCDVRSATEEDLDPCNAVCRTVHGHDRGGELRDAIRWGKPLVVERAGSVTGYVTALSSAGHAVAETNADLMALLGSGRAFRNVVVPTRNAGLFRWCLEHGLRVVYPGTLMSVGLYNEPAGAFLPSSLY